MIDNPRSRTPEPRVENQFLLTIADRETRCVAPVDEGSGSLASASSRGPPQAESSAPRFEARLENFARQDAIPAADRRIISEGGGVAGGIWNNHEAHDKVNADQK